jgi:hypothetical protein
VYRIKISIVTTVNNQTGVNQMGKLQPISKRDRNTDLSISIYTDGRISLKTGLMKALDHKKKQSYYLFYDFDNRIGISKESPDPNFIPFTFSANGECSAIEFLEDCEIPLPDKTVNWLYEGKEGDVYVFYRKGRHRISLAQDKNGNLERLDNHE